MNWQDVLDLPSPPPDQHIAYGDEPQQFGHLRLPKGKGPHPIVIVVHGGCWRARYDLHHVGSFCASLTEAGVATWSLEYRRIGDEGGGWPGTFIDVARGCDKLRDLAELYPLDSSRVIAAGHSAGGHLALWLAARSHLPKSSPLYSEDPIALDGVVSLAGIADLERAVTTRTCGNAAARLLGGPPARHIFDRSSNS